MKLDHEKLAEAFQSLSDDEKIKFQDEILHDYRKFIGLRHKILMCATGLIHSSAEIFEWSRVQVTYIDEQLNSLAELLDKISKPRADALSSIRP